MRAPSQDRTLVITVALGFIASATVTILWCGSMSSMPGMEMPGGWTMSMAWMRMPGQGWLGAAATFLGMWTVMMIAMMLPVLTPMLRRLRRSGGSAGSLAGGYFAAWLSWGLALFLPGALLADIAMRIDAIARLAPAAAGVVLLVAGALQSGAWKSRALESCGAGAGCCFAAHGAAVAAWRHGFALGLRCVRCCAPWTAVLLVSGVMDLAAMTLVTVGIGLERLLPHGDRVARFAGGVMVAAGALVLTTLGQAAMSPPGPAAGAAPASDARMAAQSYALSAPAIARAGPGPVRARAAATYSVPMNIPNEALVLVGDGRKALFLRNRGTPAHPDLVLEEQIEQDNPPTREQGTDRPGRKPGTDGVSQSAIEETDQHQRAEQRFAVHIADTLYKMGHAQRFQALVVVAPPRMLGDLRAALHPEVAQRVVGEVPKDLLSHSLTEMTRLLS